jgi:LmbE family N-acetylglucosaminyl deacetylase
MEQGLPQTSQGRIWACEIARRTVLTALLVCLFGMGVGCAGESPSAVSRMTRTARPLAPYTRPSVDGTGPILVVSPHPDDETWAMAYGILEAIGAGREVRGLLLTDGEKSFIFDTWYAQNPELHEDRNGDAVTGDRFDFAMERRREYIRAMGALGVGEENLIFAGRAATGGESGLVDGGLRIFQAMTAINSALAETGATEVWTVTLYTDGDPRGAGDVRFHPDHSSTAHAARELAVRYDLSARFYKIYAYSLPGAHLIRAERVEHDPFLYAGKMAAVREYADLAPDSSRLGLGSRSSVLFFGGLVLDPREAWTSLERLDWQSVAAVATGPPYMIPDRPVRVD